MLPWTVIQGKKICLIDPENEASIKVAENVGMAYDGHVEIDGEQVPRYSIWSERAGPAI